MSDATRVPYRDASLHAVQCFCVPYRMSDAKVDRTYGIDLLRGVACVSVMFFHYLSRGPRAGWMADASWPAVEPIARYGYLGVHLFFMVSGYVIFMSAIGRSPRAFVASRVARLFPALWVAATLTMLIVVTRADSRFLISWREYLWNLTLIPQYVGARFVDGAYWSLAVELQFYILVWIALRTGAIARVELLLWGWLALSVLNLARPMYPLERWLIANWAPLFVLGATTFLAASRGWTIKRQFLLAASAASAILHVRQEARELANEWHGVGPDPWIATLIVSVGALFFVAVGIRKITMQKSAWAAVPGALTYPVYLVHQVAGYMVYAFVLDVTHAPLVSLALTVALAIATGAVLHYVVERRIGPPMRRAVAGIRN